MLKCAAFNNWPPVAIVRVLNESPRESKIEIKLESKRRAATAREREREKKKERTKKTVLLNT